MNSRHASGSHIEWSVLAVRGETPELFAEKLEETLQMLTDDGYSIVSQMPRGDAVIITAQRSVSPRTRQARRPIDEPLPLPMPRGGDWV
jgi:hypothetical protein